MKGKAKELYEDINDCFPGMPSLYIKERIKDLIEEYAEVYRLCPECLEELGSVEGCPKCGWKG